MKNPSEKVTIKDVANLAKVSMMTVSRVFNNDSNVDEETRRRVQEAIKKLQYRPNVAAQWLSKGRAKKAQFGIQEPQVMEEEKAGNQGDHSGLAGPHSFRKQTMTIGMLIPSHRYIFNLDYFLHMIRGFSDSSFEAGCDVIIYNTSGKGYRKEFDYTRFFNKELVDGLVIVAPFREDWASVDKLKLEHIPFILSCCRREGFNFIDGDNVNGSYQIVKHLIETGHKRIATITGSLESENGIERMEGYKKALKEYGLVYDSRFIKNGEFESEKGYQAMKVLLSLKPRPTAVFCANDAMALMAIHACSELGIKVPEDMSIAGYDDCELAVRSQPPLTSVRQPAYEIGYQSVTSLMEIIKVKRERVQIILPTKCIFRGSCCKKHKTSV